MSTYAAGDNYQIDLVRTIAWMRVWKRPDLTLEQGAGQAREQRAQLVGLANGSRAMAKALLLDLRAAPSSWGPITRGAIEESLAAWEAAQRRIAILLSHDPVQGVLIRPSMKQAAPSMAHIFFTETDALDYCILGRLPSVD